MGTFERYLSVWVGLCILVGVSFGNIAPGIFEIIAKHRVCACQSCGCRIHLDHDLPDDGADRFYSDKGCGKEA
jgi:hypothetical protein